MAALVSGQGSDGTLEVAPMADHGSRAAKRLRWAAVDLAAAMLQVRQPTTGLVVVKQLQRPTM